MTHWEDHHPEDRSEGDDRHRDHWVEEDFQVEDFQEEYPQEEVDFLAEDHPQDHQGEDMDNNMVVPEEETSRWETHLRYSREYERKLSLSLLFGGSMQALTENAPLWPIPIKRAYSSSRTFKGMMWPNGFNR